MGGSCSSWVLLSWGRSFGFCVRVWRVRGDSRFVRFVGFVGSFVFFDFFRFSTFIYVGRSAGWVSGCGGLAVEVVGVSEGDEGFVTSGFGFSLRFVDIFGFLLKSLWGWFWRNRID